MTDMMIFFYIELYYLNKQLNYYYLFIDVFIRIQFSK